MKMRMGAVVAAIALLGSAAGSAGAQEQIWDPPANVTFQIQLQGEVDTSYEADVYEVDLFDVGTDVVEELHAAGRSVVCYANAGAWERWRPDKDDFPKKVLGKRLEGWPGERWLDVRKVDILRTIMGKRLDLCAEKGFDAVDFDNINGYQNPTGFPLKRRHQVAYDKMLAEIAHERGLAIGLKNVPELVDDLEPVYDFVVNESCYDYNECGPYKRFVDNDKPVFILEYEMERSRFCDKAEASGFIAQRKRLSLKAWRKACWDD
ncbi:MAG TPA: endo alpha-1,4 polygalactosaminidase [Actinomycetota bacterium]|nr:endo alpha-1,4 polygalactosaminidase [Actinomycetota bacterium]